MSERGGNPWCVWGTWCTGGIAVSARMGQEVAQVETSGWVTRGEEEDFEAACQGCTTLIRSATRAEHGYALQNRAQIRICVPSTRISLPYEFSLKFSPPSFFLLLDIDRLLLSLSLVLLYCISFVEISSIYVVGSFEENFLFLFVPRLVSFVGSIRQPFRFPSLDYFIALYYSAYIRAFEVRNV